MNSQQSVSMLAQYMPGDKILKVKHDSTLDSSHVHYNDFNHNQLCGFSHLKSRDAVRRC